MIKLDYTYSSVKLDHLKQYEDSIKDIVKSFENKECAGNDYLGWYDLPKNISSEEINKILDDGISKSRELARNKYLDMCKKVGITREKLN